MKNTYLILCGMLLLLGSCTIEKRHYSSGYHVEWNSKPNKQTTESPDEKEAVAVSENNSQTVAIESELVEVVPDQSATAPLNEETTVASLSDDFQPERRDRSAADKANNKERAISKTEVREAKETIRQLAKQEKNDTEKTNNSDILLVILCIFLPPLAVFLFDGDISTNFWVDLLLCLLFWLPGVVFAFLVCFAGVSL